MVFPQMEIKQLPRLERFDLDFDLPEHFLPEFPPAIFLTTRPDLGDVSQGKVVTVENFQEIFNGILNAKDLEGRAPAGDAVPAAAVQRHRRPQDREARRHAGRGLLRLPRQRPHLGGDPPGRRHPAAGAPPPHRHAEPARRQHPAAVRLAAGAEDGRGLHRVRAAGRLLRRRPAVGGGQGDQPAGARQPGPLHGRVPGTARLPAGPEPGPGRQARPEEVQRGLAGDAAARSCSSARRSARRATRRRTTPTT